MRTLTSMQTSVLAICLFTCSGMLLGCFFSVQPSRGVLFLQMKCLTQKFITSLSLRGSYKEKEKEYHKKLLAEMGKPDFANKNVSLDSR